MTKTEICNRALTLLGESTIISIDQNTPNAIALRNCYTFALENLLRTYNWNFAVKRANLAQLVASPEFGYSYAYQLPGDFLRLKKSDTECRVEVEGDTLVTDSSSLRIVYIAYVEDTEKFDASFSNFLAIQLARELAFNITSEASVADRLEALYKEAKREAKKNDAQASTLTLFLNKQYTNRMATTRSGLTVNIPASIQTPL